MGLYVDLTQEQKDILGAWERNTRGWFNTAAQMLQQARALQAALDASGGPRDIITALDPTEVVPNSSGLAGAHDLQRNEWAALVAVLDSYILDTDTDPVRQLFAKAAGPTAGL